MLLRTKGASFADHVKKQAQLVNSLRDVYKAQFPSFGEELQNAKGSDAVNSTILYRLTKYWSDAGDFKTLHKRCEEDVLGMDLELHDEGRLSDPDLHLHMLQVNRIIYNAATRFKYDEKFPKDFSRFDPRDAKFASSSGETFVSSSGYTDLWDKSQDLNQWAVTTEAFVDASLLFLSTRFLRLQFKHHYTLKYGKQRNNRDLSAMEIDALEDYVLYSKQKRDFPYGLPGCMKMEIVRRVSFGEAVQLFRMSRIVTIVLGGRFSSVEKDATKNRGIEPQPWMNVCIQLSYSNTVLRPMLLKCFGINCDDQDMQKRRVKSQGITTADFSSASELQRRDVLMKYVPECIKQYILAYTVDMIYFPNFGWHFLAKVSSMGCGLTFEYLTLMIASIARVCDGTATVYGDDLIVQNQYWPYLEQVYTSLGYKVNFEKTFHESKFRESCGSFYHDDFGYILTYKFARPLTEADVFSNINKLQIIVMFVEDYLLCDQYDWVHLIQEYLDWAVSTVPLRCRRDLNWFDRRTASLRDYVNLDLDQGVWSFNHVRRYNRRCDDDFGLMQYYGRRAFAQHYQYPLSEVSIVDIPQFTSKSSNRHKIAIKGKPIALGGSTVNALGAMYYIQSTRRMAPVIRGRGKWVTRSCFSFGQALLSTGRLRQAAIELRDCDIEKLVKLTMIIVLSDDVNLTSRWHNFLHKHCVK